MTDLKTIRDFRRTATEDELLDAIDHLIGGLADKGHVDEAWSIRARIEKVMTDGVG